MALLARNTDINKENEEGRETKKLCKGNVVTGMSKKAGVALLKFAKLSPNAFKPVRGSQFSAGFDLYSAYDAVVPACGREVVKTDIAIALPPGCYGRVAPRSGLAVKHFIDVGAGVIDQDYRGNVGVVMFNFNKEDFLVKRGDRIAQLILERIYVPELEECEVLDETQRGEGGYGSTGVHLSS